MMNVANGLFPRSPPIDWSGIPSEGAVPVVVIPNEPDIPQGVPPFTLDDVARAVGKLPTGKSPGPDLVPNELIKLAFNKYPKVFLECYNTCLTKAEFPLRWKIAKLVLLHKGQGKPKDVPSSYRPISLLDGVGKVFERLILDRLSGHIESVGALSDLQFGFRRSRSTLDAINEVTKAADVAGSGAVRNRDLCVLVTVDVKNAFNSAPWRLIDAALQRYATPEYLVNVLRAYMSDRELVVNNNVCLPVTRGVPQGSVLGPTLWNMFYDGLLRIPLPEGIKLIAFVDDVAVLAVAHNADLIEELVNPVLETIAEWMNNNGLQLAREKTECIVLTQKRAYRNPVLQIQGYLIPVKKSIRYLGVQLDTRLSFGEHAIAVAAGARKAASALGRLMPNVGGPSQCKRRLLMSVVHSRLLYAAPVWANNINKVVKYQNVMLQSQRCAALRVARCYRTVSDMAALVLAKMIPVNLQALNRKCSAEERKTGDARGKSALKNDMLEEWQVLWDGTTKAAWTKRLIPDVRKWYVHGPSELSFHLSQVLTDHGCFQWYLWKKHRATTPACVHCAADKDDAEHTIFHCPYWEEERSELQHAVGRPVGAGDVSVLLYGPERDQLPDGANVHPAPPPPQMTPMKYMCR